MVTNEIRTGVDRFEARLDGLLKGHLLETSENSDNTFFEKSIVNTFETFISDLFAVIDKHSVVILFTLLDNYKNQVTQFSLKIRPEDTNKPEKFNKVLYPEDPDDTLVTMDDPRYFSREIIKQIKNHRKNAKTIKLIASDLIED